MRQEQARSLDLSTALTSKHCKNTCTLAALALKDVVPQAPS